MLVVPVDGDVVFHRHFDGPPVGGTFGLAAIVENQLLTRCPFRFRGRDLRDVGDIGAVKSVVSRVGLQGVVRVGAIFAFGGTPGSKIADHTLEKRAEERQARNDILDAR